MVSPVKQHCMGGGGRAKVWEKEPLSSLNKGDDENTANFKVHHLLLTTVQSIHITPQTV